MEKRKKEVKIENPEKNNEWLKYLLSSFFLSRAGFCVQMSPTASSCPTRVWCCKRSIGNSPESTPARPITPRATTPVNSWSSKSNVSINHTNLAKYDLSTITDTKLGANEAISSCNFVPFHGNNTRSIKNLIV